MFKVEKLPNAALRKVTFILTKNPGCQVSVAGSFNDWEAMKNPMPYSATDGVYKCELLLPPGNYEYKLIIDGEWCTDLDNDNFSANDFGTLNSVINVG